MSNIHTPFAYSQMSYLAREDPNEAACFSKDQSCMGFIRPTTSPVKAYIPAYNREFLPQGDDYVYQSPVVGIVTNLPKHTNKGLTRN